jgi:hypothetical protein
MRIRSRNNVPDTDQNPDPIPDLTFLNNIFIIFFERKSVQFLKNFLQSGPIYL